MMSPARMSILKSASDAHFAPMSAHLAQFTFRKTKFKFRNCTGLLHSKRLQPGNAESPICTWQGYNRSIFQEKYDIHETRSNLDETKKEGMRTGISAPELFLFKYGEHHLQCCKLIPTLLLLLLSSCTHIQPLVVIDAGHTPAEYGAVSCTNRTEVDYNDDLAAEVSGELTGRDGKHVLTRTKYENINHADCLRHHLVDRLDDEKWQKYKDLYSRIALANEKQAGLFISIHHDSVQEHHLLRTKEGKIVDVQDDFKLQFHPGYSIYIARDPKYPNTELNYLDSLKFARLFAEKMQLMGRKPSTYHEEKPDQDNYQCIDLSLGIYNSKAKLAVLRNAKMPAVLIEAGVIVDIEEEKNISSQAFKNQFAILLVESIDAFFEQSPYSAQPAR
ncbi:MAG: N-acetylmuramoyl-L-alanine amidase [Pseudomonadota bacterium]